MVLLSNSNPFIDMMTMSGCLEDPHVHYTNLAPIEECNKSMQKTNFQQRQYANKLHQDQWQCQGQHKAIMDTINLSQGIYQAQINTQEAGKTHMLIGTISIKIHHPKQCDKNWKLCIQWLWINTIFQFLPNLQPIGDCDLATAVDYCNQSAPDQLTIYWGVLFKGFTL